MAARRSDTTRSARAFTLFELLLAIALVLALVGAMFSFLWDLLATRTRIQEEASRRRAATLLVERIERDLVTCVVGDAVAGAGVSGDESTLRILSRSVPARLAESGARDGAVFADLERSEYRFDARRSSVEGFRSVIAIGGGRDDRSVRAGFGGVIHKVRFRYHDGEGWRSSFDSLRADRLPEAVEVAIWFDPWPGVEDEPPAAADVDPSAASRSRLTFDADAGFDESTFAELSDLDTFDEPRPDRIRVIAVPDAAGDVDETGGDLGEETPAE